jgi:ABC-type dipeptide/oligopeptide/nickel transport system permease component
MLRYALVRLVHALVVIWGVSLFVFVLTHLSGDPTSLLLPPNATQEERARFREQMGFDRPILVQYAEFLGRAVRGDFGTSLRHGGSAFALVLDRVPATLTLGAFALALSLVIAIPLGILAAVRRNSNWDRLSLVVSLFGQAVPVFWFGIILIIVFAANLRWLPASGSGTLGHLILPGLTLASYSVAIVTRLLRSSLIEVRGSDYIRTARAKGLSERLVLVRHALKNAALPVITVVGLQVGALLGGAVITEEVFAYPGMGRLAVQAISQRDFPVIQAFVVLVAGLIVAVNLLVDLLYRWVDPRVQLGQ